MASIRVVGVVGAGQMGSGIAQVAAAGKMNVIMADVDDAAIGRGVRAIASSLSRFVKKQVLSQEEADATMSRVRTTTSLQTMQDADVVIEAVAENEELKTRIFGELDKLLKPSAILASNTSSISITRLAASTQRPQQVIGMHFMNPPPVMKLVEIVRGMATEDETFDTIKDLAERCGKTVSCSKDYPGFLVNRVLMPQINEAFFCMQEGVATPEDIDTAMKLGTNQPMGPLALADLIGLDTCLAIMRTLHSGLADSKYRPCPLLVNFVNAGWLGRKSGRGVFSYSNL